VDLKLNPALFFLLGHLKALMNGEQINDTVHLQWSNLIACGESQPSFISSYVSSMVGTLSTARNTSAE
jgi:hypothetical protein